MKKRYLVFTDLDGTLLNHQNYSFAPAKEALTLLKYRSIPLIIATSKTFSEVVVLQKELGIRQPFIVENGAGIFVPSESVLARQMAVKEEWIKFSKAYSYTELRLFFTHMKHSYSIKGFGDMSVDEVMQHTGLPREESLNAMKRDFSEPFLMQDERELEALKKEANKEGFDIVKGGRFFHLVSLLQDKANAMLTLAHMYEEYYKQKCTKIALGDSANDFAMIKKADIGVLVPLYDGSFSAIGNADIKKADYPGPKGWNSSILEIFDGH
ncbi:HAD-IIB family hydrolase [Psychrobacter pacificensis]|uniref:HAD-IIB family hydrolase n=1 Tax=Psychrobacter pacificensis TaxID=112002 RepID=UPI003CFDAF6F